jgi:endonuclease III
LTTLANFTGLTTNMSRRAAGVVTQATANDNGEEVEIAVAVADTVAAVVTTPKAKKRPRAEEPSPHVRNSLSQLQTKAQAISEHLKKLYPDPPIPLDHTSDFQLLCAVVLSAQTTDKKVNEVTPELFTLAPDAAAMALLPVATIANCIRTLGLAPTKAKNLQALSAALIENHNGKVPDTFEELEALPGVGHKTASVVMAQVHGHDAFPVDTHIHRLAQRWGLTAGKSVEQTEADLKLLFPAHTWRNLHLQIIFFGREKCPARGHDPAMCPICSWAAVSPYDKPGNSPMKPGQKASGSRKASTAKAKTTATAGAGAVVKRSVAAEGDDAAGKAMKKVRMAKVVEDHSEDKS